MGVELFVGARRRSGEDEEEEEHPWVVVVACWVLAPTGRETPPVPFLFAAAICIAGSPASLIAWSFRLTGLPQD